MAHILNNMTVSHVTKRLDEAKRHQRAMWREVALFAGYAADGDPIAIHGARIYSGTADRAGLDVELAQACLDLAIAYDGQEFYPCDCPERLKVNEINERIKARDAQR